MDFDIKKQITIKINTAEGVKEISLRFPTDEELCDRQRKRKVISKDLGRGMSQSKVPNAEAIDGELLKKIRVDDGVVQVDDYEAVFVIDQILSADVDDIQSEDNGYRVFLRVPGGTITEHLMQMPGARDVVKYGREFVSALDGPYGQQIITVNLSASKDYYSRLAKQSKGYVGEIPIHHKAEVIKAINSAVRSGLGVSDTDTF
jgi:hypothetical protein